jgi:hypothetical protein
MFFCSFLILRNLLFLSPIMIRYYTLSVVAFLLHTARYYRSCSLSIPWRQIYIYFHYCIHLKTWNAERGREVREHWLFLD